ncbi:hypothetical protein [Burkholderia pyrrocinia]|uniref:hypothetical protein n=1 Tax=Burkholderia pyrrocinia TaxID=60550 RepID=UPI00158D365D|nr:hypothetical protein [Burkholderia pyrrocinia]
MSGNYVSTPFCFSIPSQVLQRLSDHTQVSISVDPDYHPVYFQASDAGDPPKTGLNRFGIGVYNENQDSLSNPLYKITIEPGEISFTLSKLSSQQGASTLYFDLFLWAAADIGNNDFALRLDTDSEVIVYYGWGHGMANQTMAPPGETTVLQWRS